MCSDPDPKQLLRIKQLKNFNHINPIYHKKNDQENEIDAIIICSPAKYHLDDIILCLKHNIKILVEKPCVRNMNEAKKILKTKKSHLINVVQNWI